MALFPLGAGYCVYSAIYNEHKGWYSFILSSIYGFLLTFGEMIHDTEPYLHHSLKKGKVFLIYQITI